MKNTYAEAPEVHVLIDSRYININTQASDRGQQKQQPLTAQQHTGLKGFTLPSKVH